MNSHLGDTEFRWESGQLVVAQQQVLQSCDLQQIMCTDAAYTLLGGTKSEMHRTPKL